MAIGVMVKSLGNRRIALLFGGGFIRSISSFFSIFDLLYGNNRIIYNKNKDISISNFDKNLKYLIFK